jgi:hypothetical protein
VSSVTGLSWKKPDTHRHSRKITGKKPAPKKEKPNPPIIMRDIIISFLEAVMLAAYLNKRVQHLYYRFYST